MNRQKDTSAKDRRHTCEFIVFSHIMKGRPPSRLWKEKTLTRRQVDYALTKLKRANCIRKVGYGTWENLTDELPRTTHKKTHHVGKIHIYQQLTKKQDSVRAHGIMATLKIPRLKNWERREKILEKAKIKFIRILQGQRISFLDIKKIWLCNDSIVFYLPYSWFADTAPEAKRAAVFDLITIIRKLEKHLHVSTFKTGKGYKIKFSRNQYALIRNALAKQYDKDKKKLNVYDDQGLWLIIDNSWNLHETETVHPETALTDNQKVQNFFNSLKRVPMTTDVIQKNMLESSRLMKAMAQEQGSYRSDLVSYGKNIAAHGESIELLGTGIGRMTGMLGELGILIKRLDSTMKSKGRKIGGKTYVTF